MKKIRKIDDKVMVWFITAYGTYYSTLKEVSSISEGEMNSTPVIEKPIESGQISETNKNSFRLELLRRFLKVILSIFYRNLPLF